MHAGDPFDQAVSTIPGAVKKQARLANPSIVNGRRVACFCGVGGRSGLFVACDVPQQIRDAAPVVANLVGSTIAWAHAGLPFEDSKGMPTKRIHGTNPMWSAYYPKNKGYEVVLSGDEEIARKMALKYIEVKAAGFPTVKDVSVSDVTLGHTFWPPNRPGWTFVDCRSEDEMVRRPLFHYFYCCLIVRQKLLPDTPLPTTRRSPPSLARSRSRQCSTTHKELLQANVWLASGECLLQHRS